MDARIDPLKLMRAVWLTVDLTGLGHTAWVSGSPSGRRHFCDWQRESCDCQDFQLHGGFCKHLLAVGLRMGEPEILRRLRLLVPNPDRRPRQVAVGV